MPALLLWNKVARKYQQWQALQPWERKVLAQFAVLLPLTWLGLRTIGFNWLHRFCLPVTATQRATSLPPRLWGRLGGGDSATDTAPALELAQRYAALAAIAARHGIYQANCLHQSLPLCWLLQQTGLPAQLKIGVKPQTQPFQAHAWVELDGVSLGQSVVEYQAFRGVSQD